MRLNDQDFELFKSHQYCDNKDCVHFQQVGGTNLKTHSRQQNQIYCNSCKTRFVVTRGTIFYWRKTSVDKIVSVLRLLAQGMGVNQTCEQEGVTADSIQVWIKQAGEHVEALTDYLQQEMNLDQSQIDEFWSFIRKKRAFDPIGIGKS